MKLTWHLARKDLRRLWIPIALFGIIIAAKLVLGSRLLAVADEFDLERFNLVQLYANLLIFMEVTIGYILVAAIVHEDPLVGTSSFWMTRPISGPRLLGSKVLTLALVFELLPPLLTLPWWIACGFDTRAIARAALETQLWQLVVVLLALPFAVLTKTLGRFLACSLIALALWITVVTAFQLPGFLNPSNLGSGTLATRSLLLSSLALFGVVTVVVHQFLTRRLWRSLAIAACTLILAVAVLKGWQWDWFALWNRGSTDPELGRDISVTVDTVRSTPVEGNRATRESTVLINGAATGVPAGHLLFGRDLRQTWQFAGGPVSHHRGHWQHVEIYAEPVLRELLQLPPSAHAAAAESHRRRTALAARNSGTIAPPPEPLPLGAATPIPPSMVVRAQKEPVDLALDCRFDLVRPQLIGQLPLTAGATLRAQDRLLRIIAARPLPGNQFSVAVLEMAPAHMSDGYTQPGTLSFSLRSLNPGPDLLLVDPVQNTLVNLSESTTHRIRIAGVGIAWRTATFRAPQPPLLPSASAPDFTKARLAKFTYPKVESLHRQLDLPPARIEPLQPRRDSGKPQP